MFDIRMMSSVAPLTDVLLSIGIVLGAVVVANALLIPAVASKDRRAGQALLVVSGLAFLGIVASLALNPGSFFMAAGVYLLVFAVSGIVVGRLHLKPMHVVARVLGGSLVTGFAIGVAYWVVHLPR